MAVQIVKLIDNPVVLNLSQDLTPRGEYNAGTTYSTGDSVSYNGSSYVALQETTGNPPTNTTYWQLIAAKGDTGATGAAGADGVDGQGVPVGGTTGQVLAKKTNTDYDTEWIDETGGGLSEATAIAYSIAL